MDTILSSNYYTEFFSSVKEWDQGPFLYHYMVPMVATLFASRYFFLKTMSNLSPRKIFTQMEQKHEREFWNSVFYVFCIMVSVSLGEWTTGFEPWRTDYVLCYKGWPTEQTHTFGLKFYYSFCIAFYIYSMALLFVEEKKKDFTAMLVHHIATLTTVGMSGYIEHYRIGVCIMLLFDVCDIALEVAKLANKCKEDIASFLAFTTFVALWIRNRLYIFPVYIMPTIVNAEVLSEHPIPYWALHVCIVFLIFFLQVYWTYFIIRKLITLAKLGFRKGGEDPREMNSSPENK